MKNRLVFLGLLASSFVVTAADIPPPPPPVSYDNDGTFVMISVKIDNVREAKNVFDVMKECDDNLACKAIVGGAATYLGIPIDNIVSGIALIVPQRRGEGTYVNISLPGGYTYCTSSMKMTSIVPHDGPRGSLFLGASRHNGMYYETWTPVQGVGEGRSWVEATLTIVGIKSTADIGAWENSLVCHGSAPRNIFYCRGGGCVDTRDSGQNVDSSSPPGAGSRK